MKTEYLLHREVGHVLAALTPQNRLVCEVMLHTGLRVGDVLALRTQQLASRMWVTERKTGKRKQVGLPGDLLGRVLAQAGKEWAFPGRRGDKPRTRQAVWADVKRAARAFRLPQNAGTHSMRKVYAVDLLERYGVKLCCYGHLHGGSHRLAVTGRQGGTEYRLIAADYVNFQPVKLLD